MSKTNPSASTGTLEQWTEEVKEALTVYEIDAASERRSRDRLVRLWHDALRTIGELNAISDKAEREQYAERIRASMNLFLRRSTL